MPDAENCGVAAVKAVFVAGQPDTLPLKYESR
jgi:hypothetical protein